MENKTMTSRDFYKAILASEIDEELKAYAQEAIDKLDMKNANRKNTQTKTQKENEPIKAAIIELLTEKGGLVASAIGKELGISTQKATGVCRLLVNEGKVVMRDIKVKNKGTLKEYSIAEENEIAE